MARKTETVIATAGRDAGKNFILTEMSATAAEKWATRALLAMGRAGVEMPDDFAGGGFALVAAVGVRALLSARFEDAEPLLDDMLACVAIVPDPLRPIVTRRLGEEDIEEVATVLWLRDEVFRLHVGFSIAAELSKLGAAAKLTAGVGETLSDTPTSPPQSPLS